MNSEFFSNQITRLINTYGEKFYPDERVEMIWNWAKSKNDQLFKLTIDDAIGNCDRAPLKNKLDEIYRSIKNNNPQIKTKVDCVYCSGDGIVPDEQVLPTAYRCRCVNGDRLAKNFPRWEGPLTKIDYSREAAAESKMREEIRSAAKNVLKPMEKVTSPEEHEILE